MIKQPVKYKESNVEGVFQKLISNWPALITFYQEEIYFDYEKPEDRLVFVDMAAIASFVAMRFKEKETLSFNTFFQNVEELILCGDDVIQNLIQVGLFEDIQNHFSAEIGYQRYFDSWLKPHSLKAWREVIGFWEGDEWKKTTESEKILNK